MYFVMFIVGYIQEVVYEKKKKKILLKQSKFNYFTRTTDIV